MALKFWHKFWWNLGNNQPKWVKTRPPRYRGYWVTRVDVFSDRWKQYTNLWLEWSSELAVWWTMNLVTLQAGVVWWWVGLSSASDHRRGLVSFCQTCVQDFWNECINSDKFLAFVIWNNDMFNAPSNSLQVLCIYFNGGHFKWFYWFYDEGVRTQRLLKSSC